MVNFEGSFHTKELRAYLCASVSTFCVYVITDGRIFGWTLITEWEHFVTERFRGSHFALSRQLWYLRLPNRGSRFSRSCVTILGQFKIVDSKR